jgi:hypothetical protein
MKIYPGVRIKISKNINKNELTNKLVGILPILFLYISINLIIESIFEK